MEPYPLPGRPQALTSSCGQKRLIYWDPDRALPQFSIPPELLNTSNQSKIRLLDSKLVDSC